MPAPREGEAAASIVGDVRSLVFAAGLGVLVVWFGATPLRSQSRPELVTSDTPEYCLHLLDRVSEMVRVAGSPPPQEVTFLSTEGQRMCDQGQTRGGILRLRRALMLMMRQTQGP